MCAYTVRVGESFLFVFARCPIDFDQGSSHNIIFWMILKLEMILSAGVIQSNLENGFYSKTVSFHERLWTICYSYCQWIVHSGFEVTWGKISVFVKHTATFPWTSQISDCLQIGEFNAWIYYTYFTLRSHHTKLHSCTELWQNVNKKKNEYLNCRQLMDLGWMTAPKDLIPVFVLLLLRLLKSVSSVITAQLHFSPFFSPFRWRTSIPAVKVPNVELPLKMMRI